MLLILLILAAAGELGLRGVRRALTDMGDFAVMYTSTRAFNAGANPYEPAAIRAAWLEANHNRPTNPPEDLALYPPTTYLLLSPLALLDWNSVRWAWICINLIGVAVLIVVLTRYWPEKLSPWKTAFVAAFILGFGPIHTAFAKGQLAVVVAAILALAVVAEIRNAVVLAAILIGLAAALKPQIAAPVVVLYLLQRKWKAIAVIAAVTCGLLGIAWLRLSWAGISWISSMLRNVGLAAQPGGVYDPSPTNPVAYQLVNTSALLHRLTGNPAVAAVVLTAIGVAVCFCLWKRAAYCADLLADPTAFAAASVLGLVLIAHRYYDAAVLVFVFVWALSGKSGWRQTGRLISIAGCLILAFPVPALLVSAGHARAPSPISQTLWDAAVIQHQSWVLLIVLIALSAALLSRHKNALP